MNLHSLGLISAVIALAGCESMNAPLTSSSFDPLTPPGSSIQPASTSFGPSLSPGQFVSANMDNTAFYKVKPKGDADADKLLTRGTNMKIVSVDSSYAKVELDSGEVGFVPSVMVDSPDTTLTPTQDILPLDGAYQVYPPLPGGGPVEPLPIIDPSGLPPEGAIPTIIDPDAPVPLPSAPPTLDPIPDLKPAPDAAEMPKETTDKVIEPTEKPAHEIKEKVEAEVDGKVEEKAEEKA
ncbi:MAG: hypothetical protein H7Y36_04670, partial [Armatimonadetes bacterium]|nr:hypothetical protein [Akkermansiaceae bacterium]